MLYFANVYQARINEFNKEKSVQEQIAIVLCSCTLNPYLLFRVDAKAVTFAPALAFEIPARAVISDAFPVAQRVRLQQNRVDQ